MEAVIGGHYPEVEQPAVLAPEAAHLVQQGLGHPAGVDPHPLPHLLHHPGHVARVGHHAVVGDLGARHHTAGRAAEVMKAAQ